MKVKGNVNVHFDDLNLYEECLKGHEQLIEIAKISEALKKDISKVLIDAVSGNNNQYRMDGLIRWGRVERDIHKIIDCHLFSSDFEPDQE
jgi:type III secretory pathway component EscV